MTEDIGKEKKDQGNLQTKSTKPTNKETDKEPKKGYSTLSRESSYYMNC